MTANASLVDIDTPRSASQAFDLLSIRAAEKALADAVPSQMWLSISEVMKVLRDFTRPMDTIVSARHVRWAYETMLRRAPPSAVELGPIVAWLARVPSCALDKAAPAVLLFHYLAHCSAAHAMSIPRPTGGPGNWSYLSPDNLTLRITNEEAYNFGATRHFWQQYHKRLQVVMGELLKEMCNVAPPPAAPAQEGPLVVV